MKTLLLFTLLLLMPAVAKAGVSVCVTYGMDSNGTTVSAAQEIYCLDASGNLLPFVYGALTPGGRRTIDGALIVKGTPYFCGKTGADALLNDAVKTNQ